MLESLQKLASRIKFLRIPAIGFGILCLALLVWAILISAKDVHNLIMPAFIGLLWAVCSYSFIGVFQSIPQKAATQSGFRKKIVRHILRAWYWMLGWGFIVLTLLVIAITSKLVGIWLSNIIT